jgi:hypothetical protein
MANSKQEANGGGKPKNLPGVYRHEGSGKEIITSADPNDGQIQADAFVRVGYHWIGDVPGKRTQAKMREERIKQEEEADAARIAGEKAERHEGTTSRSAADLEEELAETKATLEALKAGKESEQKKKEEK